MSKYTNPAEALAAFTDQCTKTLNAGTVNPKVRIKLGFLAGFAAGVGVCMRITPSIQGDEKKALLDMLQECLPLGVVVVAENIAEESGNGAD